MGIEPTSPAWKAGALPLCYARIGVVHHQTACRTSARPTYNSARWLVKSEARCAVDSASLTRLDEREFDRRVPACYTQRIGMGAQVVGLRSVQVPEFGTGV